MRAARTIGIATGVLLVGATLVGGGLWVAGATQAKAGSSQQDAVHSAAGTTTVAVVRQDLVSRITVNGTLGYADAGQQILNEAQGTVTALAAEGSVVQRGQTLYEVNGQPVVLFYGNRPAWRALALGVSDGPDVTQLQQNLIALGYGTQSSLKTDGHFSSAVAAAVKRWQKALGLTQTGGVDLGRVVFMPGSIRVGTHQAQVGANAGPGSVVMTASSTTRVVTVDLDATKQTLVKVGDAVQVTLPNSGQSTTGTVSAIAKVAKSSGSQGSGNSQPTVTVTISLNDPAATGDLDQAPVKVGITSDSAKGVLAAPINALLALADGSYAVEVDQGGRRHVVPVKTGLFDDDGGLVEISGSGIIEGTQVVVPQ